MAPVPGFAPLGVAPCISSAVEGFLAVVQQHLDQLLRQGCASAWGHSQLLKYGQGVELAVTFVHENIMRTNGQ